MKTRWYLWSVVVISSVMVGCAPAETEQAAAPAAQEENEWVDLVADGALAAWRGYQRETVPGGWQVEDGIIAFNPEGERGDLTTRDQYGSFELALEWRITEGGNSGIIYRVSEDSGAPWHTGPEFQVLDNDAYRDQIKPSQLTGSNYDINPATVEAANPVGEWNAVRIVVKGNHVEHWLNDTKVVEYEFGSEDWEARVKESKFIDHPGYGRNATGHIVLQDHSDPVWYRNVRIRELSE